MKCNCLKNVEISLPVCFYSRAGVRSVVCSRSALCKVIYLCRVCCVSVTSGAWLSKLELGEKFSLSGDQQDKSPNKMNLNFCWVVLLDIAAHCFLLYIYILLYIYGSLYRSCSNFSQLGKRDFPKFIHLLFFPKSNWTFTSNGITSRSRNRFLSAVI